MHCGNGMLFNIEIILYESNKSHYLGPPFRSVISVHQIYISQWQRILLYCFSLNSMKTFAYNYAHHSEHAL